MKYYGTRCTQTPQYLVIHFFRYSASHQGIHEYRFKVQLSIKSLPLYPMLSPPKSKLHGGLSGRVSERSEFSPTPPDSLIFGSKVIRVAFSLVLFLLATQKE